MNETVAVVAIVGVVAIVALIVGVPFRARVDKQGLNMEAGGQTAPPQTKRKRKPKQDESAR